jgi:hypothetical protein
MASGEIKACGKSRCQIYLNLIFENCWKMPDVCNDFGRRLSLCLDSKNGAGNIGFGCTASFMRLCLDSKNGAGNISAAWAARSTSFALIPKTGLATY